jgi:hypothetical protein
MTPAEQARERAEEWAEREAEQYVAESDNPMRGLVFAFLIEVAALLVVGLLWWLWHIRSEWLDLAVIAWAWRVMR